MRTDVLLTGETPVPATVTATAVPVVAAVGAPSVSASFTHGSEITTSNVGYVPTGVSLTTWTGSNDFTTNGQTVDGKQINSSITIFANNVTIKRSLIVCSGGEGYSSGVVIRPGVTGTVIEDCEIRSDTGTGDDGYTAAQDRMVGYYGEDDNVVRRCYIHGSRRFFALYSGSSGLTVEDCYIGDNVNNSAAHTSGIGAWGGASYFTLRRCRFRAPVENTVGSGAIQCYPESSANSYWTIEDNFISCVGGGWPSTNVVAQFSYTPGSESPNHHIVMTGNWFWNEFDGPDMVIPWNSYPQTGDSYSGNKEYPAMTDF